MGKKKRVLWFMTVPAFLTLGIDNTELRKWGGERWRRKRKGEEVGALHGMRSSCVSVKNPESLLMFLGWQGRKGKASTSSLKEAYGEVMGERTGAPFEGKSF